MRRGGWVLLAGALAFCAFVFYSLTTVEPVRVVQSRLIRNGDRVSVAGVVRNTGASARAIRLEVHYYDGNGRSLGQDTIAFDPLAAGAVHDFKSPARTLDGVATFSIYLNGGRNPYGN